MAPIESIIKDTRVNKSHSFIITKIQFSIQLVSARTIHHSQGLSLEELIFDTWVNICNIILHSNKRKAILLTPHQHETFNMDPRVHVKMNKLKIIAT
jgi:hypothetical protein